MRIQRQGFTMAELLIVVLISATVLAMGTKEFAKAADRRAVETAREAFIATAQRARSEAMRSGMVVHLQVRTDSGVVRVGTSSGGAMHVLDMSEFSVDMKGTGMSLCYTARGYALPGCTSISVATPIAFGRGGDTAAVSVLPLGQVRRTR